LWEAKGRIGKGIINNRLEYKIKYLKNGEDGLE